MIKKAILPDVAIIAIIAVFLGYGAYEIAMPYLSLYEIAMKHACSETGYNLGRDILPNVKMSALKCDCTGTKIVLRRYEDRGLPIIDYVCFGNTKSYYHDE